VLELKRQQNQKQKQIWVTLSSFGNETHYVTKIFKRTNVRIAYKTKCTLQQLLKPNLPMIDENKFDVILTVYRR